MSIRTASFAVLLSSLALAVVACDAEPVDDEEEFAGPSDLYAGEDRDEDEQNDEDEEVANDCSAIGLERECDEGAGRQFCDAMDFEGTLEWGPCLDESEIYCEPGDSSACSVPDLEIYGEDRCELQAGIPTFISDCDTPLVLKVGDAPIAFEPAGTATFDIAGAGGCVTHDWPTAATPWLAIDLDKNGSIDDGRELFGSGTRLRSGARARDGFSALAELDSDGDGFITPRDDRFGELVLWSDHDHDRRSTLWELEPLSARGVSSIALDFVEDPTCDARGNCARERSAAEMMVDGRHTTASVVDVHLSCQ